VPVRGHRQGKAAGVYTGKGRSRTIAAEEAESCRPMAWAYAVLAQLMESAESQGDRIKAHKPASRARIRKTGAPLLGDEEGGPMLHIFRWTNETEQ
jgi:hypothetical protein